MKKFLTSFCLLMSLSFGWIMFSSYSHPGQYSYTSFRFPYQKAGLTEKEAAAHLISRFTFGATVGQVEEVTKAGLEKWFEAQLNAGIEDKELNNKLSGYASLKMSNEEIVKTYPKPGQVLRVVAKEESLSRDSVNKKDYKKEVKEYMDQNGLKPQQELMKELASQKIVRAACANNQLQEVLTDFWFNHFNVAVSKNGVQQFVTSYERDVIRPNVTAKFETLLLATAKSPAMLTYLDNNKSSVNEENRMATQRLIAQRQRQMVEKMDTTGKVKKMKQGLNENYAREIMELHALGVDGGYTQADVTEAARVLTGWSLNPEMEYNIKLKRTAVLNEERLTKQGFVFDHNFLFAANRHDKGEKKVLGQVFPAGGGYEEGVRLIHLLATHPSTAKFISKKLAVRFVSDNPPKSLVDKMAKTFLDKEGDIKEVLLTMVSAPEFWSKEALREKTKSPFELAISAVRATNAQIENPLQLYQWVSKMGQKMYNYQAPTGFPDRGQYWINTGSLLNRMNFGLALASGRIPGVKFNLLSLNNNREPESAEAALAVYSKLFMPGRNIDETVKRLTPMLSDPELASKVDAAAGKTTTAQASMQEADDFAMMDSGKTKKETRQAEKGIGKRGAGNVQYAMGNNTMLSQVVGIIIGSPEFQRR
jgi:uncharacterized protein (DUF1800 family)